MTRGRAAKRKAKPRTSARALAVDARITTGVPGLDDVLGGGLIPRRFYLIKGVPGAGKTVLVSQLCFHRAPLGDRCVYVTMLAETNAALIENLQSLAFFDPGMLTRQITFVSGYQALADGGLKGLSALLGSLIEKHHAQLLVLDGLAGWPELTESPLEIRYFMREVGIACSLLGCTPIATMPPGGVPGDWVSHAENVADGIFELSRSTHALRSLRTFEVTKLRGSTCLEGKHAFEISRDGIIIHPRIEAYLGGRPAPSDHRDRCRFGVDELDTMLRGGVMRGSTTVMVGASGAGKTVMGLHFLAEGARRREKGLYFGFYEAPERLVSKAAGVGIPLRSYMQRGDIELVWQPALERSIDAYAARALDLVRRRGVERLFVDGIDAFKVSAVFQDRLSRFLMAFTNELRRLGVTTLLSEEAPLFGARGPHGPGILSGIFENMLMLRFVELRSQLYRLLSIVKLRKSDFDSAIREFHITSRGIRIASTFESAEAILSGYARQPGSAEPNTSPRENRRPRARNRG